MRTLFNPLWVGIVLASAGCTWSTLDADDRAEADAEIREAWQSHMDAGEAAAREGRFERAEREFLAATGSVARIAGNEPLIFAGLQRLARLYADGGRPDAAESVLRKAAAFAERTLGPDAVAPAIEPKPAPVAISTAPESTADSLEWPLSLADDLPLRQDPEKRDEFNVNVNLWPILESRKLPDGNWRTSLWPFFHVTTRPEGGVHSWHVLNFLSGPRYSMLLPLYYSIDDDLGILPPLFLSGEDYWTLPLLLTGRCGYADGDHATWVTPLFHLTLGREGQFRSMHLGPYLQWENSWAVPLALAAGWSSPDGSRTTWVTPLFHWSTGPGGAFVNMHLGPFLRGDDFWAFLPLAGGGTYADGSSTLWITPLFHRSTDPAGRTRRFLVGPYAEGEDWWAIPPLLTLCSTSGRDRRLTSSVVFWTGWDDNGLKYLTLFPAFFWSRDNHWCFLPALSGGVDYGHGASVLWLTPLFHYTTEKDGAPESIHVGPFFWGQDYWTVPPLLSWQVRYADRSESLWLTPFFHLDWDPDGRTESAHLFPAFFWERDAYWAAPLALSASWSYPNGDRTLWVTPFFHWTQDDDGNLLSMHLGPYLQGETYWAIPPLLTAGWSDPDGGRTTWATPLFHATQNAAGDLQSLHLAPIYFWKRDDYWAVPPLLSWGTTRADGSRSTYVTPFFHDRVDARGDLLNLTAFPLFLWERDQYLVVPPLLSGSGVHADGARTTWISPLFHDTVDKAGALESLHVFPFYFWKRDDYWTAPLLLSAGWTTSEGSRRTWISPLYHEETRDDGTLVSRHVLNYFEGPTYHHLFPVLWDWRTGNDVRHTMVPPIFFRTEEPNGTVTASVPWPIATYRSGKELDTSVCMELRPFVYQTAGEQYEMNVLWRMFSILREEKSTRVMVGPLWHSEKPAGDAMTKFQILGGLFARDCNYETERYRYRFLWLIKLAPQNMASDPLGLLDLHPIWSSPPSACAR